MFVPILTLVSVCVKVDAQKWHWIFHVFLMFFLR